MFINNFDPVAIEIFSFEIRWYSLAYIFGILLGWLYCKKKLINDKKILVLFDDLLAYLIIGIIVGGRIGYVIFYNPEYYLENLHQILMIWNGGMSFHGGLIGVFLATIIFSRKHKIDPYIFLDLISLVAPIGIFFGRIANFINGELYGRITENNIGIIFQNGGPLPRHPSQLYEALFEGIILYLILNFLFFLTKLKKIKGAVTGLFLLFYGFFRFFIEYFREPDNQIGLILNQFTMGQILCIPMMIIGIIIFKYALGNKQNA